MTRFLILISLICMSLPVFSQDDWGDVQCEDTCRHIHGIDISHYQSSVYWKAVGDNHKMAYVYIKATEGGDKIDSRYVDNIRMAKQAGLKVGSYHFFRPKVDTDTQLKNFASQCRPQDQDLVPMIDVEVKGATADALRDSLSLFLEKVTKYYHQRPLIYTGKNFYNTYLSGGMLDDYKLMIAQYSDNEPYLSDERDITMWQYTGKGHIDGINGNVDKSRFMGKHGMREIRFRH